jgi:hypothetical protein
MQYPIFPGPGTRPFRYSTRCCRARARLIAFNHVQLAPRQPLAFLSGTMMLARDFSDMPPVLPQESNPASGRCVEVAWLCPPLAQRHHDALLQPPCLCCLLIHATLHHYQVDDVMVMVLFHNHTPAPAPRPTLKKGDLMALRAVGQ